MTRTIKEVFILVAVMIVSLMMFSLIFGDVGKTTIWGYLEPVFQTNWERATFDDGTAISERLTITFDNAKEIHEFKQ